MQSPHTSVVESNRGRESSSSSLLGSYHRVSYRLAWSWLYEEDCLCAHPFIHLSIFALFQTRRYSVPGLQKDILNECQNSDPPTIICKLGIDIYIYVHTIYCYVWSFVDGYNLPCTNFPNWQCGPSYIASHFVMTTAETALRRRLYDIVKILEQFELISREIEVSKGAVIWFGVLSSHRISKLINAYVGTKPTPFCSLLFSLCYRRFHRDFLKNRTARPIVARCIDG